MKLTNKENIPLEFAVWLAHDDYDHSSDPKEISVTTLIKPLKQIILSARAPEIQADVSNQVASAFGTAIHNTIEHTWVNHYRQSFEILGYPKGVIDQIKINPSASDIELYSKNGTPNIPIYLENRSKKRVNGWTVSGKYDLVIEGKVKDIKTTKTYSYMKKSKDSDYILQGSIYKWLNPDIITNDIMSILYYFTNWNKLSSVKEKGYPSSAILEYPLKLLSHEATENFIKTKLFQLETYWNSPEADIAPCSQKELWQDDPVWKYYKDPNKLTRSTKNFDNLMEATNRLMDDGSVGIIKEIKGKARACIYCPAVTICKQAQQLVASGQLVV